MAALTILVLSRPSSPPEVAADAQRCHARGALPDRTCTPGATDPAVSEATIDRTICRRGYTRRVRPPVAFTAALKRRQMAAYGYYAGRSPRSYEEDHLIALEIGGSARDARNLWPQERSGMLGSGAKDAEENVLHARVCGHALTLAEAQRESATDWVRAYRRDRP